MRVWIDALTPKQANLFSVIVRRLGENGHETVVTTRHYREVEQLLQIRGTNATVIGRHGGGDLSTKLTESSKRIGELAEFIGGRSIDSAISFCSPEAARVAYGLGISHYAICDSPHAEAVCRLSLPLSKKLFAPSAIPRDAWQRYGVTSSSIIRYKALDPVVWIRAYAPGPDIRRSLGLDEGKPIVVLRTEEEYAAYLFHPHRSGKSIVTGLARPLRELGAQVVVLPRYEKQLETLSRELAGVAFVPAKVVDTIGLLSRSSVFIGAGGTMSAEAALMGVPTISCYPSTPTYVDRYLFKLGLAERILSPEKVVGKVRELLASHRLVDRQKEKAKRVLAKMEDPVKIITGHLGLS
jgi:predicted glycosyltransferase